MSIKDPSPRVFVIFGGVIYGQIGLQPSRPPTI